MSQNAKMIFQDGSSVEDFAVFDHDTNTIKIQTDDSDLVGSQKTIIRDCDSLGRLLELNLYIEILPNTHPDFVSEIETSWKLAVGDVISYKLPPVVDPDGNDVP